MPIFCQQDLLKRAWEKDMESFLFQVIIAKDTIKVIAFYINVSPTEQVSVQSIHH